jgi:diamine N-acetyltransferase
MGSGRVHAVTGGDFILVGERAALGMLRREQLPDLATWFNDPEVRCGLAHRGMVNVEAEEKWFEAMTEAGSAPRPSATAFAVHAAADGELVGTCSLEEIDHNFLRASFGIFLGRRRREGIGSDATRLTLDWAFHVLGLRNVMLEVYDFNEGAMRAYERAGFRVIGRRRDAVLALGARRDSILMDATVADFDSPVLSRLRPAE